jgi:hypothetical protein
MIDIYNHSQERVPNYTNPQLRQPDFKMQSQTKGRKNATRRRIIVKNPYEPHPCTAAWVSPNTKRVQCSSNERETLPQHYRHLSPYLPCPLSIS